MTHGKKKKCSQKVLEQKKEHIKASRGNIEDKQLQNKKKYPVTHSEKFHAQAIEDMKHFMNGHENHDHKNAILDKVDKSMRERRVFKYGYWSILHYIIWCVIWRRNWAMRTKRQLRDHLYYEVGENKLQEELDWVTIIKSIRQLKILTQILLSKQQKFLIKFQRNNVIDSSSSETSDEGNTNIVSLMKSTNQKYKEGISSKIHK